MSNPAQIVERYLEAFNETDAARRAQLVSGLYADDSTYTDPHVQLRGPAEIERFIAETQARFPGWVFKLGGPVDAHHDQARFQWHAAPAGAMDPQYVGFDVIVADNGRIRDVYGFMDAAPAS